jgi:hypothetical protein
MPSPVMGIALPCFKCRSLLLHRKDSSGLVISSSQRTLPDKKLKNIHKRQTFNAPTTHSGIRTNKRATVDTHFRPFLLWFLPTNSLFSSIYQKLVQDAAVSAESCLGHSDTCKIPSFLIQFILNVLHYTAGQQCQDV